MTRKVSKKEVKLYFKKTSYILKGQREQLHN